MDFTTHPFLHILLSLFLLFIWVAWIFIWVRITIDVLRRRDIGGWYKAIWIVLLIFVPLISGIMTGVVFLGQLAGRLSPNRTIRIGYACMSRAHFSISWLLHSLRRMCLGTYCHYFVFTMGIMRATSALTWARVTPGLSLAIAT